ncbi:hypothetical protein ACFY71_16005 [Streptomyces cinerochromogenes]|uniref:PknH-like extracellular domain-containing protein n=1 Tax=Streptomyces cinerochromogenes TaxID=66422 RepID=A0ABW7B026_9ACTN
MRLSSRAATLLAVAVLPLALSACSSDSSSGTGASAAPAKAKNPNAGLLTGTQLKKALAPASAFPAGFTLEADGASDSGGKFLAPSSRKTAKPDCTRLEGTSWIQVTGFEGGVAFAQDDYVNQDKTEEVAQEVDAFQGTTAKTVMKQMQSVAAECATFTDTDTHAKVKVKGASTAGFGDEAYTMTLTSGAWETGTTLIAARSGNHVVTVLSTAGGDDGAAAAKKVTTRILDSLKGKSAA